MGGFWPCPDANTSTLARLSPRVGWLWLKLWTSVDEWRTLAIPNCITSVELLAVNSSARAAQRNMAPSMMM